MSCNQKKTDDGILYKQILINVKLQIGKKGKKKELTVRSPCSNSHNSPFTSTTGRLNSIKQLVKTIVQKYSIFVYRIKINRIPD